MGILGWLSGGVRAGDLFSRVRPRYRAYWDRTLNAIVTVDLADYGGRYAYYWGRCGDVLHQTVLRRFLKPGDTYIDVGANIGFHSMFASRIVAGAGKVLSFEPHPETFRLLTAHLAINRISNVCAHNVALGDAPGEALLSEASETHSGTATLRSAGSAVRSMPIRIEQGDALLGAVEFGGDAFLKVDVEGFELRVLRGLSRTLARINTAYVEVTPEWLASQGVSATELYREMARHDFTAYLPRLHWKWNLFAPELRIDKIVTPLDCQHNVLFMR